MRKQIFILLVLVFSISVIGCGSVNAKNDNVNANMTDAVTNNDAQADTEKVSEVSVPETKTDFKLFSKGYSGSVYTLPVGSPEEVWSESDLDAYLADCRPFQDNCVLDDKKRIKIDFDRMIEDFGFEYVGTNSEIADEECVFWMQRGNLKYVVILTHTGQVYILLDTDYSSCCAMLFGVGNYASSDQKGILLSKHLQDGEYIGKVTALHLKGIAASLKAVTSGEEFDAGRLPYPAKYDLRYPTNTVSISAKKDIEYMSRDVILDRTTVY